MKLKYFLFLVVVLSVTNVSAMERNRFGIGVILGEPTGITGKIMIDDNNGLDAGIGWETSGDNLVHIYGDYLLHFYDLIDVPKGKLPLYFGGGARLVLRENKDDKLGLRIPVGVEYLFEGVSLGAFIEIVPILNLTPDTDFDLEAGTGIRYFF